MPYSEFQIKRHIEILDEKAVKEIDFGVPIYSSPIAANGVLYVATHTHLFAIAETKK